MINLSTKLSYLVFYSFQFQIGYRSYNQREFFNGYIASIKPETSFFRKTYFFQPEIEVS